MSFLQLLTWTMLTPPTLHHHMDCFAGPRHPETTFAMYPRHHLSRIKEHRLLRAVGFEPYQTGRDLSPELLAANTWNHVFGRRTGFEEGVLGRLSILSLCGCTNQSPGGSSLICDLSCTANGVQGYKPASLSDNLLFYHVRIWISVTICAFG